MVGVAVAGTGTLVAVGMELEIVDALPLQTITML